MLLWCWGERVVFFVMEILFVYDLSMNFVMGILEVLRGEVVVWFLFSSFGSGERVLWVVGWINFCKNLLVGMFI